MKKLNLRKFILLLADIFIIAVSGIVLNYGFALTKWFGVEATGNVFFYVVISILTCELMMLILGSYSRLWRYFSIVDYLMCALAMTIGFALGYGVLFMIKMQPRLVYVS